MRCFKARFADGVSTVSLILSASSLRVAQFSAQICAKKIAEEQSGTKVLFLAAGSAVFCAELRYAFLGGAIRKKNGLPRSEEEHFGRKILFPVPRTSNPEEKCASTERGSILTVKNEGLQLFVDGLGYILLAGIADHFE